jgi:hypothetical protein
MPHHYYLEEEGGDLILHAPGGSELQRFSGQAALQEALAYATQQGFDVRSTLSPMELIDHQRIYFRRRSMRYVALPSNDPPNVHRVIVPDDSFDDFFAPGPTANSYPNDQDFSA